MSPLGRGIIVAVVLWVLVRPSAAVPDEPGPTEVVLDPGHGGSNTGSPGRGQVLEKSVNLSIAKAVHRRLQAAGVRVALTRTRDHYLPIRARARIANAHAPRCFVSIHSNATADHAQQGVETYLLSREAIEIGAYRRSVAAPDDAAGVLAALQTFALARASLRLAESVQRGLVARSVGSGEPPADRGVRQAAHDVLADAEVPAILVEVGFLDHPVEGPRLASPAGQAAVADRLAAGILSYLRASDPAASPPLALGR